MYCDWYFQGINSIPTGECWDSTLKYATTTLSISFLFRIPRQVKVKVTLRPTISRPVRLGVRRPSGTCDQFFYLLDRIVGRNVTLTLTLTWRGMRNKNSTSFFPALYLRACRETKKHDNGDYCANNMMGLLNTGHFTLQASFYPSCSQFFHIFDWSGR
jgi:hypothetical protein